MMAGVHEAEIDTEFLLQHVARARAQRNRPMRAVVVLGVVVQKRVLREILDLLQIVRAGLINWHLFVSLGDPAGAGRRRGTDRRRTAHGTRNRIAGRGEPCLRPDNPLLGARRWST